MFNCKVIALENIKFEEALVRRFIFEYKRQRRGGDTLDVFLEKFFKLTGHDMTFEHTYRTGVLANQLWEYLIHSPKTSKSIKQLLADARMRRKRALFLVGFSSKVHDIGKLAIPTKVVYSKQRLSADEYDLVQNHTIWGQDILAECGVGDIPQAGAMHHHENCQGTGYPHRLYMKTANIKEFIVSLLAFADSLDAMTSTRSYRKKLSFTELIAQLEDGRDKQWSAIFVDALFEIIRGRQTLMNNKTLEVRKITPNDYLIIQDGSPLSTISLTRPAEAKAEMIRKSLATEAISFIEEAILEIEGSYLTLIISLPE